MIVGVSRDKPETQKKWAEKLDIEFPLLSDPEEAVHLKYGAWGEKNMYGKKVTGPVRSTIIIDENGKVARIYRNVKAEGHAAKVLANL